MTMELHAFRMAVLEEAPIVWAAGDGFEDGDWEEDVTSLPDMLLAALSRLVSRDQIDQVSCMKCAKGVGFLLDDDDDSPRRGQVFWRPLALAQRNGGPIYVLCWDCAPDVESVPETPKAEVKADREAQIMAARAVMDGLTKETPWYADHANIVTLVAWMADSGWDAGEIARAVEKPWCYRSEFTRARMRLVTS